MNRVLNEKIALITGGSRGLGFEIAKKFLQEGAFIVVCSRDRKHLEEAFESLCKVDEYNKRVTLISADISKPEDVDKVINATISLHKEIHILVNNAGIYGPKGPIEDTDWSQWIKTLEINLFGSVLMSRAVIRYFKKQNFGKIIQLSGGGATNPMPMISAYAVSKAAIVRFNETLAKEVEDYNIDINSIAPGPLNTQMLDEIISAGPGLVGEEFYSKSIEQKKSGGAGFGKATELALFLASSKSNGISSKLISALWDNWENWVDHSSELKNSDVYTLRRITGKDRGFFWGDK